MIGLLWALAKPKLCPSTMAEFSKGSTFNIVQQRCDDDDRDASHHAFMQESALDEMAVAGGIDALDLRRRLMAPYPVALTLIDTVAKMSGWGTPLDRSAARGFAFAYAGGHWLAKVVEVSQRRDGIRIEKVFCAADVGMDGHGWARRGRLLGDIRKALVSAIGAEFDPEMVDPVIELQLLSKSSAATAHTGPLAWPAMPALANAIFALTGNRIRRTPLGDEVTFV